MYTKTVYNGYIYAAGEMQGGVPITMGEFGSICNAFQNKPAPKPGYNYLLKDETLEWALIELPPTPAEPITEDAALTRYANELTGTNAETLQEATETLIKQLKEE